MIYFNKDKDSECIVTCKCHCGEGFLFSIEKDQFDNFFYQLAMDARWNTEQHGFFWKLKKIWAVIWNKDYCYSELCLNKDEFEKYKEWINRF